VPHFQVLYVAPLQAQAYRYSSLYLKEAITTSVFARDMQKTAADDEDVGPIIKSVAHQAFKNGAGIQLTYAKTSADRARGIFCDQLDCDEIQDHLVDNLAIIMQSLTQSAWGMRRYTGTAKTLDNTIEYYWQHSSRAEWAVPCDCKGGPTGRFWNIPDEEHRVFDMIQAQGPTCTNCGSLLNVRLGEWIHGSPDMEFVFPGYHVPQIVVPAIANNPRKWAELVYKVAHQPVALTMQEFLGISSSLGARLITQQDIDKYCVLPVTSEMIKPEWRSKYYKVIAGIDWGIAEQQSFTVLTILGIRRDGKMHVLWIKRYAGFDTDHLLKDIAQTCRAYKADIVSADFGMGFAQNSMLAHRFGLPVVQIQYARQQQLLNFRPLLGLPRWTVDKVAALEVMYWGIRYGRFAFPPKHQSDPYTRDLLSPYEETSVVQGLEQKRFMRNPNIPDDFAHALCFAMLAGQHLIGGSLLNIVPEGAMGADVPTAAMPQPDNIDMQAYERVM